MCCVREEKSSFLTICYWNIHGWRSKIIGNKLVDPEFLQKNSKFDIVALAELHCEKEVANFANFVHKAFELRNFLIDEPKRVD
jgi:hypothetical protein